MGAAQPANAAITVFQRLRTVRGNGRHTSVKHLTTPFDTAYVAVPGEEVQVVETRDSSFKSDAFRYGHPVVIAPRAPCELADVYTAVSGLDFPVRMVGNPREIQIQKAANNVTDDMQAEVRSACPGTAFVA
jgi:hypothetical protein